MYNKSLFSYWRILLTNKYIYYFFNNFLLSGKKNITLGMIYSLFCILKQCTYLPPLLVIQSVFFNFRFYVKTKAVTFNRKSFHECFVLSMESQLKKNARFLYHQFIDFYKGYKGSSIANQLAIFLLNMFYCTPLTYGRYLTTLRQSYSLLKESPRYYFLRDDHTSYNIKKSGKRRVSHTVCVNNPFSVRYLFNLSYKKNRSLTRYSYLYQQLIDSFGFFDYKHISHLFHDDDDFHFDDDDSISLYDNIYWRKSHSIVSLFFNKLFYFYLFRTYSSFYKFFIKFNQSNFLHYVNIEDSSKFLNELDSFMNNFFEKGGSFRHHFMERMTETEGFSFRFFDSLYYRSIYFLYLLLNVDHEGFGNSNFLKYCIFNFFSKKNKNKILFHFYYYLTSALPVVQSKLRRKYLLLSLVDIRYSKRTILMKSLVFNVMNIYKFLLRRKSHRYYLRYMLPFFYYNMRTFDQSFFNLSLIIRRDLGKASRYKVNWIA